MKEHQYQLQIQWIGNEGKGTKSYRSYSRNHTVLGEAKSSEIHVSSDPSFLGDSSRYNPEELFLSSLSSCHMLWYLHLCSVNKVVVLEYSDHPIGIMQEDQNGSGRFTKVTLYPEIRVQENSMVSKAEALHEEANKMCFIANSCNFKIGHQSKISVL